MKKLLAVTLMALSLSASADKIPGIHAAGIGYVSEFSDAVVAINANAGTQLGFSNYSAVTRSFCGVAGLNNASKILAFGYSDVFFTAPTNDLYLVVCVKSFGLSSNVIVSIGDPWFYGVQSRSIEHANESDVKNLEAAFSRVLK